MCNKIFHRRMKVIIFVGKKFLTCKVGRKRGYNAIKMVVSYSGILGGEYVFSKLPVKISKKVS
jgi:hypothetical protein